MHANRAAGNVPNAHQMVLVVLRGSLFLHSSNLHTQNDVYFPLANPCSLLCTADVIVRVSTKIGSSDRFRPAMFCCTESPQPPLTTLFLRRNVRNEGKWCTLKVVHFEAKTFNFSTSIHLFHLSPHLVGGLSSTQWR